MIKSPYYRPNRLLHLRWQSIKSLVLLGLGVLVLPGAGWTNPQNNSRVPVLGAAPHPLPHLTNAQKQEAALQHFHTLAFASERGGQGRQGHLVLWEKPPRFGLFGRVTPVIEREIDAHLAQLSRLTGMIIRRVPDSQLDQANVKVFFWDKHDLLRHAPPPQRPGGVTSCFARLEANAAFEAIEATVLITHKPQQLRRHCITEEISQIMGLMNDPGRSAHSAFADGGRQQDLSDWDRLALWLLYRPELHPGMMAAQAMPLLRRVLRGDVP